MSVDKFYARARYGNHLFTFRDMGVGPVVWFARYCDQIGAWNVKQACKIKAPGELIRLDGGKLHPMLVAALEKSIAHDRRTVAIRQAKGRLEAILETLA